MIDRLVHHAEVVSLRGDSYRLKDRDLGGAPAGHGRLRMNPELVKFHLPTTDQFSVAVDTEHGKREGANERRRR
jgi:hypothetical protein